MNDIEKINVAPNSYFQRMQSWTIIAASVRFWISQMMTGRPLRKMDFLVRKSLLYAKIVRMNK